MTPEHVFVYIGTYTRTESEGIYVYRFDDEAGDLTALGTAEAENPSFLALHPQHRFLYAVGEGGKDAGAVNAFELDPLTGQLTHLNQRSSHGTSPCHLAVERDGRFVYVANYGSGTLAVYPIEADGRLGEATDVVQHEGSGPNPRRQQGPHAHSITLDRSNRFAFAADLGADRLMIYELDFNNGKLLPNTAQPYVAVAPGAGPRHFTFHPTSEYAYLINEMGNSIVAFDYDAVDGRLTELQTVPTLPEDFDGKNTCADIHVAPSGDVLYGSNRGHDSLVIYAIDRESGELTYRDHVSTGGATPRNFAIDPSGNFLLAANQDSDNVVVFRIDRDTGALTPTGHEIEVPMPVCVKFLA